MSTQQLQIERQPEYHRRDHGEQRYPQTHQCDDDVIDALRLQGVEQSCRGVASADAADVREVVDDPAKEDSLDQHEDN